VSWRDLLRALDGEAAREVEGLRASAAEAAERILGDARRDAEAERQTALAGARAEAESRRRRALAEAQRERARAVLVEQRAILDEVRAEALERLRREDGRALAEIVDAAAAEVGDAASTWVVDAASLSAVRERLERDHAGVLARAELRAAPEPRGGIEVAVGRRVLDATAAARLDRSWPDAEVEISRLLFGGDP
jgi:vacuolar-type H+-ATPase subunit E/Vma4